MAAEHGVDLATIEGTGVGGRIRKQDVLAAAEAAKAAPASRRAAAAEKAAASRRAAPSPLRGKTEPMSRLRKVIAKRMVESLQTSAQLTQVVEVDVTKIARLRDSVKTDFLAREGVKLSYLPFFAKAAVDALKVHPTLNATIDIEAGEVTYYDSENIAFAVDTEKGLLTPVVKEAGRPLDRRPGQEDRRRGRAHAHQQDRARRPVRRHLHDHQPRQRRAPSGTPRSSTSRRWRSSDRAPWSSGPW